MSDDLNKKIQQIAELLGQDNMPDNVKNLLGMLAGSIGNKEESPAKSEVQKSVEDDRPSDERPFLEKAQHSGPEADPDLSGKFRKTLDRISAGNDPRINLLHAIKPFMSGKRQKKISNCIQLLQMTNLTRLFNDNEK